jgi:hypothetical protein
VSNIGEGSFLYFVLSVKYWTGILFLVVETGLLLDVANISHGLLLALSLPSVFSDLGSACAQLFGDLLSFLTKVFVIY